MNEAQISLAGKISDSLKRLIASKLGSQYKDEAPYSGCLVQEGILIFWAWSAADHASGSTFTTLARTALELMRPR